MATDKVNGAAKKLHTHVIVFKKGSEESKVAGMAMFGQTTKEIAKELGITESQAQYRISKSQDQMGIKFRSDFRNGGVMAKKAMKVLMPAAENIIQREVAPKFLPLATSRVNQ